MVATSSRWQEERQGQAEAAHQVPVEVVVQQNLPPSEEARGPPSGKTSSNLELPHPSPGC